MRKGKASVLFKPNAFVCAPLVFRIFILIQKPNKKKENKGFKQKKSACTHSSTSYSLFLHQNEIRWSGLLDFFGDPLVLPLEGEDTGLDTDV